MTRRRAGVLVASLGLALLAPVAAAAYSHLAFTVNGEARPIRWSAPVVRWFASDAGAPPGVSAAGMQAAVERAFDVWEAVPTANVAFEFVGFTSARPFEADDLSVFGFRDEPGMDRVLGATTFVVDVVTGEVVESDVFFNTTVPWSTSPTGEPGHFDLQSVATHEAGHFLGLGHSAIGETELQPGGGRRVLGTGAVMFPISLGPAVLADRVLEPDDVAGVSVLYPAGRFTAETGAIAGRVRTGTGAVFGAHVVAFELRTGALVGGLSTGADGAFSIGGLSPGTYVLRVEPLDDADVDSFLSASDDVDVDFLVTFHPSLVAAPRGGTGPAVDVTVIRR